MNNSSSKMHATTIVAVRKKGNVAIAGDGQVTLGNTVMKNNATKVKRIYNNQMITGFAGSVADALTLYELMEKKLDEYNGNLMRSCVELAKEWRTDKYLRRLEAMLLIADKETTLLVSGTGEVIEPENDVIAIGSGGDYARSAALALVENTKLTPKEIAKKALQIAGNVCIYTNVSIIVEEIKSKS